MMARAAELKKTNVNKNLGNMCRDLDPETTRIQSPLEPLAGSRPHSQGQMWGQHSPTVLCNQDLSQAYSCRGMQLEGQLTRPGGTLELKNELREVREELKEKIEEIKQIKDIMNKDFDKLQEFVDLLKGMQKDMDEKMDSLLDIQKSRQRSPRQSPKTLQMPGFLERDGSHTAPPTLHQKMAPTPRSRKAPLGSSHPSGTCEECSFCAPKNNYNMCSKEPHPAWPPYSPLAPGATF